MRQSDSAFPSSPSTLFTTAFSSASIRATRTLKVGSMPGCLTAGISFPSSLISLVASLPLGGGLPTRVYGIHSSGTLRATQCWQGVSRLHRCFRLAHSAQDNATRRFFFLPDGPSSEPCFPGDEGAGTGVDVVEACDKWCWLGGRGSVVGVRGLLGDVWYDTEGRVAQVGYAEVDGLGASQPLTEARG